jgi:large subunit ribosomal protein L19
MDVRELVKPKRNPNIPQISPGDTVKVSLKTKEGDKERLQNFQGVVIKMRKGVDGGSFTVRRVSYGIGVERTFPFQSPSVQNVEVLRHGKVRRAKLYYIRRLSVKQARLKERRERAIEQTIPQEEQAMPKIEQATSPKKQAVSQEEQATPKEEQAVPQEEQATPKEEQAVPQEDRAAPQEGQAIPQKEQAVSQEEQDMPQEEQTSE